MATVVAIVGSLLADALLVAMGTLVFPATKGYVHFHFADYAKLTIVGVIVACAAWPIVPRLTSVAEMALLPTRRPRDGGALGPRWMAVGQGPAAPRHRRPGGHAPRHRPSHVPRARPHRGTSTARGSGPLEGPDAPQHGVIRRAVAPAGGVKRVWRSGPSIGMLGSSPSQHVEPRRPAAESQDDDEAHDRIDRHDGGPDDDHGRRRAPRRRACPSPRHPPPIGPPRPQPRRRLRGPTS